MTTAQASTLQPELLKKNDRADEGKSRRADKTPAANATRSVSLLPPGAMDDVIDMFRGLRRQWLLSTVVFSLLIGGVSALLYMDYQYNRAIARQMSAYRSCVNTLFAMHVDSKSLSALGIQPSRFYELNDLDAMGAELSRCTGTVTALQQAAPPDGWSRLSMRTHLSQITTKNS